MISNKPSSKGLEHRKFCAELPQPHNSSGNYKINTSTRTSCTSEDLKGFVVQWVRHQPSNPRFSSYESTIFHDHHMAEEIHGDYLQTLGRELETKKKCIVRNSRFSEFQDMPSPSAHS